MKRILVFLRNGTGGTLLALLLLSPARATNVLTEHNDISRDGANTNETILTTGSVTTSTFGKLFADTVDGQVYAQPLYVQGLNISGGTHNVVFVCTETNSVYAFDADTGGITYWHVNLGTPFTPSCGDLTPVVGITGTPVIDISSGTLYVDTKLASGPTHKLHALDITTGSEKFGGPVTISATGFAASVEHQRPGLLLLNGVVYVGFGSHCDNGAYHGFLLGYNATTLAQVSAFNVSPSGSQAAIWQGGGGPAADSSGNIYVMTANGTFDGTANYGESYVKLNGSLSVLDYATPANYASLNSGDTDFGTGGPVLINGYVVGMGKDGIMYVANTSNMGHLGNFAQTFSAASGGDTVGPVVYWNGPSKQYVFATHANSPTKSFQWNGTSFTTTALGMSSFSQSDRVGGASLSANGTSGGILWEIGSDSNLRAYDAVNFPTVLWSGSVGTYVKMNRPTIANGKVYVGTASNLGVYGLLITNADFVISASPNSQTVTPGNGTSYTVTVGALNGFNGTVSLSASGLPSGASASFNPTSITGSGTSTMSVTTSSGTPIGTSTLTIMGTFGSTNHTTTVSLVVANGSVGAQPVSINFVGLGTNMAGTESAGVVAEGNWNNAVSFTGSNQALEDNAGGLTTATLTWSADHNTMDGTNGTPGNYRMMQGAVNTSPTSTTTVAVSGLPASANGWTVYVYCEENTGGATRVGAYKISGTGITTTTINATDPNTFNGTFTQANNSTGNYVVFTIGNVSAFTISATPVSASDGVPRAPLNGIQYIPITGGSAPPPPTGLTPTAGNAQVALTWNASSGATSYNVKRSTTSGGPYTTITNVATTSYTDTGLANGTTYYYVVSALNSNGESANSGQVSATPTATTLLSQGHPVTVSSFQAGNVATNGNDGNFSTRWAAANGTFPQWWRVDLGAVHSLQSVSNYWYSSATRSYKYQIQVSNDDTNYTTVVNKTNNVTDGNTSDAFSATNRYVRIYVTGASAGFASFYESQVFGN